MKSLITDNQSDSDSDKENTDICSRKNILSKNIRSPSQSHYRSYLEELNDNVNYNNIDSVINIDRSNILENCKKRKLCKVQNKNKVKKVKRWTWEQNMVEALLFNIEEYKAAKTYEGTDFEADVVTFYSSLREMMASVFPVTDFGPVQVTLKTTEGMTREELLEYKRKSEVEEKQIKDGYNRIKSKVKELRRGYKNAADSGSRSGSGRIIAEYFDILKEIWGGSPAVTALSSAIASQDTSQNKEEPDSDSETEDLDQQPEKRDQNKTEEQKETEDQTKIDVNNLQKYRDHKRSHMVKKIPSEQRDMILIDISREELHIKNKMFATLTKQIEQSDNNMKAMIESVKSVGNGIKEGLAMLAQSLSNFAPQQTAQPPPTYYNQTQQMSLAAPSRLHFTPSSQVHENNTSQ